jgi:type III pantothenate kinase
MNLVIDWGNSTLKTAWFDGPTLIRTNRYNSPDLLLAEVENNRPEHILVSSTNRPADEIQGILADLAQSIWVLDSQTAVPIRKAYDTPHTLGADRVAGAVGAITLFPSQDCLILDLGTCLTADFVDGSATFRGGLISPGLRMRFRAMHEQTARLPLIEFPIEIDKLMDWPALTATNTKQAMQSGVLNGLLFELSGIIEMYRRKGSDIVVLVTGGDGPVFESRLKPPIFAVPDLVLIGLNRILRYNVENLQAHTPDTTV